MRPLADEIRPQTLDEVAGQKHLLGEGALLRRLIESGAEANLIFYGPSGTGKTTIANIIAHRTKKTLYHLNATTASLQDVKAVISDVDTMLAPNGVLLYLDEIQYFNKKQQQSLLEFMENGKITLIASTTENPFFYVYNALLSRSTVFEFKALTPEETVPAVERALALQQQNGWARFVTMQDHYNLIYREEENEMLPLCQRNGVAVIPWSPLARGRLTRPWGETTARLVSDEFGKSLYSASEENDAQIAGNLADVAEELDASRAQVALAWLLSKPGVAAPIIGPSRQEQLDDLLQAVDLTLSPEQIDKLEAPYQPHPVVGFK